MGSIAETPGVSVHVSACPAGTAVGAPRAVAGPERYELCLVRRGCFSYRDRRGRVLADPATCIFGGPGELGEVSHPVPGGDRDLMVFLSPDVFATLAAGDDRVPLAAAVSPPMQVTHRRLLAAARTDPDPMVLQEMALDLVATALSQAEPARVAAGRPATRRARRQLVEDARMLLATDPAIATLTDLAARLCCSPHHLSRLFAAHTGISLGAYRTRLRLNLALDYLTEERMPVAEVAARCGFADHGHLTRTVRRHLGDTPTRLRALLG